MVGFTLYTSVTDALRSYLPWPLQLLLLYSLVYCVQSYFPLFLIFDVQQRFNVKCNNDTSY